MSGEGNSSGAEQARDSLASIFSYYEKHCDPDQAPDFVKRISAGEIQIGIKTGAIPSEEQGTELKRALAEALKTQDAIDKLSKSEKDIMLQAAQASLRSRNKK